MSKVLVDRELLELAAKAIEKHHSSLAWPFAEELRNILSAQPAVSGLVPDVDDLSNFIRGIDGSNKMGAGALAERICDWIASPPSHLSFEQLKAAKRARVNAFLHERQNELLVNMLVGIPSAEEGE
jgi:hypothetical protein